MTKTALAIRHVSFEDAGAYTEVLDAAGYELVYRDAGRDDIRARDLADMPSVSVAELRADAARFGEAAVAAGQKCLAAWRRDVSV